jgi:hypothetical protein
VTLFGLWLHRQRAAAGQADAVAWGVAQAFHGAPEPAMIDARCDDPADVRDMYDAALLDHMQAQARKMRGPFDNGF